MVGGVRDVHTCRRGPVLGGLPSSALHQLPGVQGSVVCTLARQSTLVESFSGHFQEARGLPVATLLQVPVVEPMHVVCRLTGPFVRILNFDLESGFVGANHIAPPAERQKDMRRHVLRVCSRRCDLRVRKRHRQAKRRVDRIVERVNEVVRGSWMHAICVPDLHQDCRRAHVGREVAVCFARSEYGEPVEARGLVVFRIRLVKPPHRFPVLDDSLWLRPILGLPDRTKKNLHGPEIRFLSRRRSLGSAFFRCATESQQDGLAGAPILLPKVPKRVVIGHRFSPVRQGEVWVDLLCSPE